MTTEKKTIPPPSGSGGKPIADVSDQLMEDPVDPQPRPKAPLGFMPIRLKEEIMVEDVMKRYLIMPIKMNLGDLQATDRAEGDIEKAILLIAKMSKIPVASAMAIDSHDIQEGSELGEYIHSFL